jgi:hypothetical protein
VCDLLKSKREGKIKLDTLVKYKGRVKTKVFSLGLEVGSFYFNPKK